VTATIDDTSAELDVGMGMALMALNLMSLTSSSSGTLDIGNAVTDELFVNDSIAPSLLMLGAGSIIGQTGGSAARTATAGQAGSPLIKQGTIDAGFAGDNLSISNCEDFQIQNATNVTNGDDLTIGFGQTFENTGSVNVGSGSAVVNGAGPVKLDGTAQVELGGAVGPEQSVTFGPGAAATLKLDDSQNFFGTIYGLTAQDTLDLADISFATAHVQPYAGDARGGTLTITDGTHTANLKLSGDYTQSGWTLSDDHHGGTNVVDPPLADSRGGPSGPMPLDFPVNSRGVPDFPGLDFPDLGFSASTTVGFLGDASGGTLSVNDSRTIQTVLLLGNYLASTFVAMSDGHGGTFVSDPPAFGGSLQLTPPHP